jgi:hypothetical protein
MGKIKKHKSQSRNHGMNGHVEAYPLWEWVRRNRPIQVERQALIMSRLLFTVEDSFMIKGQGLVPVPGIVPQGQERFGPGDPIELRRPDGIRLTTRIASLELVSAHPPRNDWHVVLRDLSKDDVPVGTEVWSVDDDD